MSQQAKYCAMVILQVRLKKNVLFVWERDYSKIDFESRDRYFAKVVL